MRRRFICASKSRDVGNRPYTFSSRAAAYIGVMNDIPLADAVLALRGGWDDWSRWSPIAAGTIEVLRLGDRRIGDFPLTYGAGEHEWDSHPDRRLQLLKRYCRAFEQEFALSPADIRNAISVIPEWRGQGT